jgi:hypothetical protein
VHLGQLGVKALLDEASESLFVIPGRDKRKLVRMHALAGSGLSSL